MKQLFLILTMVLASVGHADPRPIPVETKKIGDAIHWVSKGVDKIQVAPGEDVKFIVKHDLEGGFDFHGFSIPELGISAQVDRAKGKDGKPVPPTEIQVKIPADMKPGNYKIGCQFHPKHVPATLVVKPKS